MSIDLHKIFSLFECEGTYGNGNRYGSGHIHDTYLISTNEADKDDYILQRLNHNVFRNIPLMQDNIQRVTAHIREKLSTEGRDTKRECLNPVISKKGKSYIIDDSGNFWRIYIFIKDHTTYDVVDSIEKAYQGGRAIGRFQVDLSDLPPPPLNDTIPHFHNVEKRLETFNHLISLDPAERVRNISDERLFVTSRAEEMKRILHLGESGKIPLRITHNDTKFNNILFDRDGSALCIIDLDTVMPGYIHYDFGDAIRTATSTAAEDEPVLAKITMDISLFRSFAQGYLEETIHTLNKTEIEYLSFAPLMITYIMGLRFLSDYIDGDRYYKIDHGEHNLQRARAQFKLVESMEEQYPEMKQIISDICSGLIEQTG